MTEITLTTSQFTAGALAKMFPPFNKLKYFSILNVIYNR